MQVGASWSIAYLCEGDEARLYDALKSGCIPRICKLFANTKNKKLKGPCLRIIGNISFGHRGETKVLYLKAIIINKKKKTFFKRSFIKK
jgi:hypothetical protein